MSDGLTPMIGHRYRLREQLGVGGMGAMYIVFMIV